MSEKAREPEGDGERRRLVAGLSTAGMGAALVAAYGTLAAFMVRFLYPARPSRSGWLYVENVAALAIGDSIRFRLPSGSTVNITRQDEGSAEDFTALSSTCPHLGCQVHWESQNERYFCPCHNGVFNPDGKGIAGPPGDAGLDLPRYPLKVEGGLLFIEVPLDQIAAGAGTIIAPEGPPGPGHDPCLYCRLEEHS